MNQAQSAGAGTITHRPHGAGPYLLFILIGFLAGYCLGHKNYSPVITEARVQPSYVERKMEVTAYCAGKCCCGKWADGYTASGHKIMPGDKFVAADKSFAFGCAIAVPGYGRVKVQDRGGAIKGDRLDVFFPSHQKALNWGRQTLLVRIEK